MHSDEVEGDVRPGRVSAGCEGCGDIIHSVPIPDTAVKTTMPMTMCGRMIPGSVVVECL